MSSQTVSPSGGSSDTGDGGSAITTPGNVVASDNAYAVATADPASATARVRCSYIFTGLGPFDAIDGIETTLEQKRASGDGAAEYEVRLIVDDSPAGDNKATNTLTAADANYTHGGAADKWGLTLIGADLLSGFGLGVRWTEVGGENGASIHLDHAPMTVTYTQRRPVTHGHYGGGL